MYLRGIEYAPMGPRLIFHDYLQDNVVEAPKGESEKPATKLEGLSNLPKYGLVHLQLSQVDHLLTMRGN